MVCPSTLGLSELPGGWVLGSISFLEVNVEACQVQRGEGTISLGGWAAAEGGGRGHPHLCGLPAVCPALCLRTWLHPGPPRASFVTVYAGSGCSFSLPFSHKGVGAALPLYHCTAAHGGVKSSSAGGLVGSWP